ncbi:hypothetical protein RJ639_044709 [Escallonia herrerae]|uniref:Disease resistance protein RPM1 n=1 Tax=Escallonia herrerae TaxID=1293975 RepID=A0AA88WAC4_9ASTE|nr:hypothetical protein RJ639_044709 [Escallonia herrerae]
MALVGVDLMIGKIVSILENEASLLGGVYDELDELKRELKSMRSCLEDADRKRFLTQGEKSWVEDVRDMCNPVEDIIEEFIYHMNKPQKGGNKFTKHLYRTVKFPENLLEMHRVASRLQVINKKLKSIPERRQRYLVDPVQVTISNDNHRRVQNDSEALLFAKGDHLVGIEDDERLVVKWLTDEYPGRSVISVVGMGGSGKSALAAKVYKNQIIKQHFECYAWIVVSQKYVIEDIFRRMIEECYGSKNEKVPADLSAMRYKELLRVLVDYLAPKRYIVVIDDVWDRNLWSDINVSLQDEGRRSRVILTTRKEEIASSSFGVKSYVHYIEPLKPSDAWDLFCMKAFSSNSCPEELQHTATKLVRKCGGLPLALLALGGVMYSKKTSSEWIDFISGLNQELRNNPGLEVVKGILFLSFSDLPYQLKRCFLYCSIFPEDYQMYRGKLVRLWMAEGFIEHDKAKTPFRLAEDNEEPHRKAKKCQMHDLVRELAISMSEAEKFSVVYTGEGSDEEVSTAPRLSIQTTSREIKSITGLAKVRSLFVFLANLIPPSSAITLPTGLRLIRVLYLEDVPMEKLPEEIGDLFNFSYLNLKRTKLKELPKSIGRLSNLQTLDIRNTKIDLAPKGIGKLEKLQNLYAYHDNPNVDDFCFISGIKFRSSICKLKSLKVFNCVTAEPNLLKQLRNMTQLISFGITNVRKEDEKDLCIALQSMSLLRNLFVMVVDEEEYLGMNSPSFALPGLKNLVLVGKLETVPRWFGSLQNLTSLYLHLSKWIEDPLPHIQVLANLGELALLNAYAGRKLCFSTGFNKLVHLYFRSLSQLQEIIIDKGVMPGLQRIYVGNCSELRILPRGIEYLTSLEKLDLVSPVSTELLDSIRDEDSVDRPRVRHIPEINHFFESASGISHESLSGLDFKKELRNYPGLEVVKGILFLSFSDLPYQLKRCFLYCSIFPEDYQIYRGKIVRLWIAEGFVEHNKAKTPLRLAEEYFTELVQRSMLQAVTWSYTGRPRKCQMHDLVRELAISISEAEKFSVVYNGEGSDEGVSTTPHLSIQTSSREIK